MKKFVLAVVAIALCGTVGFWWRIHSKLPARAVATLDEEIDEPAAVANPGYLGPQACAECHAARVAEFQKTSHFRTCRVPESETMAAGFAAGRCTYATRDSTLRFEMSRTGND